jgi:hypothetical protein
MTKIDIVKFYDKYEPNKAPHHLVVLSDIEYKELQYRRQMDNYFGKEQHPAEKRKMILREVCTHCGGSRQYSYHNTGSIRSKTTKMRKGCKHHWIVTEERQPAERDEE